MKEQYEQFKVKAQQKNRELQNDLQKMLSGKSTMGSLFSKGNKEDKIVNIEKAIASVRPFYIKMFKNKFSTLFI